MNVSWYDAQDFIGALNAAKSLTDRADRYRLPTEVEWERACRAGTETKYSFGDDERMLPAHAWFKKTSSAQTHLVGEKSPNAFGVSDMHGNVWEWCEDHWHDNFSGAPTNGSAWIAHDKAMPRVIRGGSYADESRDVRSASRFKQFPSVRADGIGFRLARTVAT